MRRCVSRRLPVLFRGGLLFLFAAAAAGAGFLACAEGPQGVSGRGASLSLLASVEPVSDSASQQSGDGLLEAFRAADVAGVRVVKASGGVLADRDLEFSAGEGGSELRLELTVEEDRVPVRVELDLRRGSDPLFVGTTSVDLVGGERVSAELSLEPEPAGVVVPSGPVVLEALGDTAEVSGAVVFATGDTIPGLRPRWSSADASVVEASADGTLVARGEGQTEVRASRGDLSASLAVEVDQAVASLAVSPDSMRFSDLTATGRFEVSATDPNGHAVGSDVVEWTSTASRVVSVDGEGRVSVEGEGTALVVASAMGTADSSRVVVELGPTGQVEGQVGEVEPPSSSSSTSRSAFRSPDGSSGGASLTTDPAGGVTVNFRQGGEVVSSTTTGSDGSWTSPLLPPGTYELEYVGQGLEPVRHPGVELEAGSTGSVSEVPMVPASDQPGTVSGRVLNGRTGGGVGGAVVELHRGFENPGGAVVATGEAGPEGSYELSGVEAGTYTLTAEASGFDRRSLAAAALGGRVFGGQDVGLVPPPAVTISSPSEGASFGAEDFIPFRGSATDPEQGELTGEALVWRSSEAGRFGTGREVTTDALGPGEHTITLSATNDDGATGEASVGIEVVEETAGEPTVQTVAYVANVVSDDVSVIDVASASVTTTVPTGGDTANPRDVAFTPDGSTGFIANSGFNTVAVFDPTTNSVTTTIQVGEIPSAVAVTPDGTKAYVVNSGFPSYNVSVIDVAAEQVTGTIGVSDSPVDIGITPDGSKAYVAADIGSAVDVIDVATNTVVATIGMDGTPRGLEVGPNGEKVYVADSGLEALKVIDVATNSITEIINLPGHTQTFDVGVTPDGSTAYVTSQESEIMSVVDLSAASVTTTISLPGGLGAEEVAVTPQGGRVYVAESSADQMAVIDPSTNTVLTTIPVGNSPVGIAFREP